MNENRKPLWHGVVLVAGGAIGAGMFALPMVSAGMWFAWAVLGLIVTWAFTYAAARLLADVNLTFAEGASFHSMVRSVLGPGWAWGNDVAIAFIMAILMYAYITAGAEILAHSLDSSLGVVNKIPRSALSVVFALVVGMFVWLGTSFVSRVTTVFLVGLVLSFIVANTELVTIADWLTLLPVSGELAYSKFLWAAIPVFVTAFACAGLVPSLVKHYRTEPQKIRLSLLLGTQIVLLTYFVWLATTFASLPRDEFLAVAAQGGKIEHLVNALQQGSSNQTLHHVLKWFSHFAIITSFLGIGLGLFHFLCDALKLGGSRVGRAKAAILTFLPPAVMSVYLPYGFVKAIGFAGLLVAFSFFIVPAWMHIKQNGLRLSPVFVMFFGVLVAVLKMSLLLQLLPAY